MATHTITIKVKAAPAKLAVVSVTFTEFEHTEGQTEQMMERPDDEEMGLAGVAAWVNNSLKMWLAKVEDAQRDPGQGKLDLAEAAE